MFPLQARTDNAQNALLIRVDSVFRTGNCDHHVLIAETCSDANRTDAFQIDVVTSEEAVGINFIESSAERHDLTAVPRISFRTNHCLHQDFAFVRRQRSEEGPARGAVPQ